MKQYRRTGSEKADGYSRDAFDGLDDREKVEVFRLLESELPFSVGWLFLVDPKKALPTAQEKEEKLRGGGYDRAYMLQEELLEYTGDLSYQDRMIEDYPNYAESLKPLVVDAIGRTPPNAKTLSFFKQVILTETNEDAVARASRRLLAALRIPRTTEIEENNYRRLVCDLRSQDLPSKIKALAKITQYEKNVPSDR